MAAQTPPSPFRPVPRILAIDTFGSNIDTVGDIHGCVDETVLLLDRLGHRVTFPDDPNAPAEFTPAPGRALVFVGDLTDRGPRSPDSLRLLEGALASGAGFSVMGNHDSKLLRALAGQPITIGHGLQETLDALQPLHQDTRDRWRDMLLSLPHQIRVPTALPGGDGLATIVHGAAPAHHQDQSTRDSMNRAHYGYADGSTDSHGNLIRDDWALHYTGARLVVHGHTPMSAPRLKNRVVCIDTGAVFGGWMSSLALDTGTITQVASATMAKARPDVLRDPTIPAGTVRQFPITEEQERTPARTNRAQNNAR